jgi:cobyrinic acid a,c-diamide synthase
MNNVLALYTHVHAEGTPQWAPGFIDRCRRVRAVTSGCPEKGD